MRGTASALLGAAFWLAASSAHAGPTFTVNSLLDVPAGDDLTDGVCETATGNGVCTLRAAIMEASHVAGGDATIVVSAGTYFLSRPRGFPDEEDTGDLDLLASMTIEGRGPSATVIHGGQIDRIFDIPDVTVVLRNFSVRSGGSAGILSEDGGCIRSGGDLTLDGFATTATCVGINGAAIYNGGSLVIRRSVISGAVGGGSGIGGGIHNALGATLAIEDSQISGNSSTEGGGLANLGDATIARTSILSNHAGTWGAAGYGGGGIYNTGTLGLANVTVSGNTASQYGAGLYVEQGSAFVVHSTIANNRANSSGLSGGLLLGGGISQDFFALVNLRNSIVAGNLSGTGTSPSECLGTITSGDHNVIAKRTTCTLTGPTTHVNASDVDNPLGLLAPNGGFSQDHYSSWGATIPLESCTDLLGAPLRVDGRGYARGLLGMCEPGAVEESGIYAPDPVIGVELLRNGGADGTEFGLATSGLDWAPAPYWAQMSGVLGQVAYGALDFPTTTGAPDGSGVQFFAGGLSDTSAAAQLIDISSATAEIDAGNLGYRLAGAFGGYLTDEDYAYLYVEFRDETGNPIIERTIGGTTAAQRGNQTGLLPASEVGLVPAGTRTLFVDIIAVRLGAQPYNDGYADDLSLVLPEPGAAIGTASALSALVLLAARRRR